MERFFGFHFGKIRIHPDAPTKAVGAAALARGDHLYFSPGRYRPHTLRGQELLGHELAHRVQQEEGRVRATGRTAAGLIDDRPRLEKEARTLGRAAARSRPCGCQRAAPSTGDTTAAFKPCGCHKQAAGRAAASAASSSPLTTAQGEWVTIEGQTKRVNLTSLGDGKYQDAKGNTYTMVSNSNTGGITVEPARVTGKRAASAKEERSTKRKPAIKRTRSSDEEGSDEAESGEESGEPEQSGKEESGKAQAKRPRFALPHQMTPEDLNQYHGNVTGGVVKTNGRFLGRFESAFPRDRLSDLGARRTGLHRNH